MIEDGIETDRITERKLLLEELKYCNVVLRLGKETGEPYCLQFNDDGYDKQYSRFDNATAIPGIAEKVTDEQLVSFFSKNAVKGYTFKGRFYTLKDGVLVPETDWPSIKDSLIGLGGKHPPGSVAAVLHDCYKECVEMGRESNNYLHIQTVARDLGATNFGNVLTGLELAEAVIRNKGDIRIPSERIPLVEAVLNEFHEEQSTERVSNDTQLVLPDDLFEDIIGHDDIKELLRACLLAEKPVHVLLVGPPALAKTLFLWDIERAAGEKAIWLVGSATSKGGLWDKIAERQSQIILIDELHTMNAVDTAGLLSIMEGGRMVRTKVGRELEFTIPVRVVAACNRLHGLSPELLSRFAVRKIQAYNRSDYLTVVKGVLIRREGIAEATAEEIAQRLDGRTQDVRQAVNVARLVPQLGVEKAIKLILEGYGARIDK
jgi:Holliday junction DNA helicase RuvB